MPRVRGTSNRFPQPYFSLVLSKIRGRNLPELWESLQKLLKTIAVNILLLKRCKSLLRQGLHRPRICTSSGASVTCTQFSGPVPVLPSVS